MNNRELVLQGYDRQDPRERELYYNGRSMSPEPLPTDGSALRLNQSLSGLAMWLSLGHACTTVLEPGDGTRYELLLVPAWQGLTKFQGTGDGRGYMFVCYMVGGSSRGSDVLRMGKLQAHNLYAVYPVPEEEWTKTFVAWWLNRLWELVEQRLMPLDREVTNA